jgi:hypothetical protein
MSEEPDIIRAQFRKAFEAYTQREREMAVLPEQVRQLIGGVTKMLPGLN